MHELGIATDLWNIAKANAIEHHLKKITKISIVIGEASGFEIDFLRHSLIDHVLPGTIAEGAELVFIPLALEATCDHCGVRITKETIQALCCPQCGKNAISIASGRETYVQSIEGE